MIKNIDMYLVTKDITIKQAMKRMSKLGEKEIFVIDDDKRLFGAISDGDIRKWILKGGSLGKSVVDICNKNPKFVDVHASVDVVKKLMISARVESVPVVDAQGYIKDVMVWNNVFVGTLLPQKDQFNVPVIIMAGGKGTRLDPFTRILPKPLIPIGDKPIIELIMERFNAFGIHKFFIAVNHKSRMIKSYFEETNTKYQLHYLQEAKPLGTAGALRMLEGKVNEAFILTNSDVLIDCDYHELFKFHQAQQHALTLVVSMRHFVVPYGVCDIDKKGKLKLIKEKPEHDLLVNAGMYVGDPAVIKMVPKNSAFNMIDLINKIKSKRLKIGVYPVHENAWLDIGQWDEYKKATSFFNSSLK